MFVRLFRAAVPNITEQVCDQTRHLSRTASWAAEQLSSHRRLCRKIELFNNVKM